MICNISLFRCCRLCLQSPSLDFPISVSFSQYTPIQLILSLLLVQRRLYLLNCIHGFRAAHAILPIVCPNQHITHKINIRLIQQRAVLPINGTNQLTLWLFITAVSIQRRIRHTNNYRIFFQICDWIPIQIDCKAGIFTPSLLHLVKISRDPFHLLLLIIFILLGAIYRTYIGFA